MGVLGVVFAQRSGITVSYGFKVTVFGCGLPLAIPSGFRRSRIRRNCGYTLLAIVIR